jgi:hypothetical protein
MRFRLGPAISCAAAVPPGTRRIEAANEGWPTRVVVRWLFAAALSMLVFGATTRAEAYPWMIRHGYGGCLTCHSDPSGGETLAPYGRVQGDLLLRMQYGKSTAGRHGTSTGSDDFDSFDSFDDAGESAPAAGAPAAESESAAEKKEGAADDDADAAAEEESGEGEGEGTKPKSPAKDKAGEGKEADAAVKEEAQAEYDEPSTGFLWGLVDTPDWLMLGGSYRHLNVLEFGEEDPFATFPMQFDLYGQLNLGMLRFGGSLGLARVRPGAPHARAAQVTTNQGGRDTNSSFTFLGDGTNIISRWHWAGVAFGSASEFLVRAGRINLPYGLRIPEHTMWVREATRTDRESDQQHGLAFAYSGANIRGEAMLIAGNYQVNPDRFRERGYSLYIEGLLTDWAAIGVSSLITHAEADIVTLAETSTNREAHGVFARVAVVPPVVLLAEFNGLIKTDREFGYAGMLQADYEPVQGFHVMLTGEILDEGASTVTPASAAPGASETRPGLGEPRLGGWLSLDWFFLPQLEARVDAIMRQEDPFTLLTQLHVYL